MRLSEARDLFASRFEFPVEREAVLEQVGDVEIEAPTGDAERIGTVLGRTEQATFASSEELQDLLITFVSDQYVGRKFYDDRGANVRSDLDEVSF